MSVLLVFELTQQYKTFPTKGTITILLQDGVTEQIKICHNIPYKDPLVELKTEL